MMGFVSGLEALRESMAERVLSSGSRELDLLIGGGAKPRTLHLFYGDRDSGVDELVHRILARCMLQPERGGLGGKAIYLNCGNYRRERTVLDSRLLIRLFRASGLDPDEALKDVCVICSFSLEQQEDAVAKAMRIVEADADIRLVVVHNIAKLFLSDPRDEGRDSMARIPALQKLVLDLWRTCAERGIVLVASCRPVESSRSRIPKPEGGKYLGHMSGVIVYLRER